MTLCDSHIHVVGPLAEYPQAANRTYTAGPAPIAVLQQVGRPLGVERFVIVQPSFYGTDNSALLATLGTLGGNGRGVAVVNPATITEPELSTLSAVGVRGLRINLYSTLSEIAGNAASDHFAALASIAWGQNWHIEVLAPIATMASMALMLAESPVPVVIDHYGLHQGVAPTDDEGASLLDLLRQKHVWMKLSAPYRSSSDPLATSPDPAWLDAILAECAERCVWGSDWPHTPLHALQTGDGVPLPYRALDYPAVLRGFRDALPDAALAKSILCDNPARLYGFG